MAQTTFFTEVLIAAAPERVGDFLRHFPNYARIHPLITAIRSSSPRPRRPPDGSPPARWYQVTDRLRLGPIPFSFTYDVALAEPGPQVLLFEVWQWPSIHLHNRTTWRINEQGATQVREDVSVQAPGFLLAMVVRIAQKAHAQAFALLKTRLESEPVP
jgi:hypothetical protein